MWKLQIGAGCICKNEPATPKEEPTLSKEELMSGLRGEDAVLHFDTDEEFEAFAVQPYKVIDRRGGRARFNEEYTPQYLDAIDKGIVFVVNEGSLKSTVNRRKSACNLPVKNLVNIALYFYDIEFDGQNLCPDTLYSASDAQDVIIEKWREVCGEDDTLEALCSKMNDLHSLRPLIDAVEAKKELCKRLIIKEYGKYFLFD